MANGNILNGSAAVFFFVLGGLVGAALGTLFGPWEARETRTRFKELLDEVKRILPNLPMGRLK